MIIDLILDRKENKNINVNNRSQPGKVYVSERYTAKNFYDGLMLYNGSMPDIAGAIIDAMDGGTEEDVKKELCYYIIGNEYNKNICDYIQSKEWLKDD